MASNFEFLKSEFQVLANFGELAEKYCFSDSNSCLMKLGMIGEMIVKLMFTYDRIPMPAENTAAKRINVLLREGFLTSDLADILHELRKKRNLAAHENYASVEDGKALIQMAYSLCEWFMQTYGDYTYVHRDFVMPALSADGGASADREKEEEKEAELIQQAETTASASPEIPKEERRQRAGAAASQRQRSEAETRYLIDEQLRKTGWEADTQTLRYSEGTRPEKGHNRAIAEWPVRSGSGYSGYIDYALFAGERMVGVIEAKAEYKDIPSVIDYQGKYYAENIRKEDAGYQMGEWNGYKVPFVFATNGRPYLKQYETKSGIWFLDLRALSKVPKALQGWMSPEGMLERLEKDMEKGNEKLQNMSCDFLRDKDGLNLREYQIRAIQAAEKAIIEGKREVLLAMATGTGKTRTVLGMIYRFLKTERFRRILFLVDRTALGEQAEDVFKEVKLEELMTLDDIYNMKGLEDKVSDKETRIQIATVQGMVKRILYNEEKTIPSVTDYDLVICDEAHRGYLLDREMGEEDLLYRDQKDYQSRYRTVIEYFDAVKIALTATPALQTTRIFGFPVFQYTYREAVIEGYLVDHDAPHKLTTRLGSEGIHYHQGDQITTVDPVTGELVNSELLEDELDFEIESFNRRIVDENFDRTVLEEIARDIDPENPKEQGKTLIYAVNDAHADLIVKLLREIYEKTGVDHRAIMKITGKAGEGNKKLIKEAIKRFKNEDFPSVVVTVDLLTTGIDVPEITTLVFMRRVKSRILFEQMLGRATRLCPEIHKTHFEIYDPVGVYESLEPVNTMKPVVVHPTTTFTQLLEGLELLEGEKQIQNQVNQMIAKLQRRKQTMSSRTLEHFIDLSGGLDPVQLITEIRQQTPQEAKNRLLKYHDLFGMLQETREDRRAIVISKEEDKLLSHTRGYGSSNRPEDYLDAFSDYITTNLNEIAALNIICTRPKELTREGLKSLCLKLDREGFTQKKLNTAVSQVTNEEYTADMISLIRRYAIGSTLMNHEARIRRAVDKLKKMHNFSKQELSWLVRMEKYLLDESVLNLSVFDEDGRFRQQGGFKKINKIFQNDLESIVLELNEYLYDDGGRSA